MTPPRIAAPAGWFAAVAPPLGGPETAFLGLGSNLGEPLEHLQRAVDLLDEDPRTAVVAVSSVYQTAPVGGPGQDSFLNLVARVETRRSPRGLLRRCQAVEAALHRVRVERWGPRTIDVDLLLYGQRIVRTADLVVPHPRLAERAFALVPLMEVAPGWSLPGGPTLATAVGRLAPIEGVTMVGRQVLAPAEHRA